jgi:hypothetical protein
VYWLKKRSWKPHVIADINGQLQEFKVKITNLPFLQDEGSAKKKFAYAEFGQEFLMQIHERIGGAELAHSRLQAGADVHAVVTLRSYPPITLTFSGKPNSSVRVFNSDIADILLNAFSSVGLQP